MSLVRNSALLGAAVAAACLAPSPAPALGATQPAIATQPNGKILVTVARDDEMAVARLGRDGKVDRSFGRRGFASTGIGSTAIATGMNVSPSGAIDVAVEFKGSRYAFAVLQLTKNGRRDRSFGVNGVAQPFSGREVIDIGGLARSVDGHLLVGAASATQACGPFPVTQEPCQHRQLVFSLDSAGELDSSFGAGGVATIPVGGTSVALAVAQDGRVLTASQFFTTAYVGRLTPDGQPDPTFGSGAGYVQTSTPISGVAALAGGEILAGGANGDPFGDASRGFGATLLQSDGIVDSAFAEDGAFLQTIGRPTDGTGSLLSLPGGGLVLSGPIATGCRPRGEMYSACRLSAGIVRLDADGVPVSTFGQSGVARFSVSRTRTLFDPTTGVQMVASRDGLRIAAPWFDPPSETRFARAPKPASLVLGVRPDGGLDRDFGEAGYACLKTKSTDCP